jgi:hypothetical protein
MDVHDLTGFVKQNDVTSLSCPGVYALVNGLQVQYVGMSRDSIISRIAAHSKIGIPFDSIYVLDESQKSHMRADEAAAILAARPPFNKEWKANGGISRLRAIARGRLRGGEQQKRLFGEDENKDILITSIEKSGRHCFSVDGDPCGRSYRGAGVAMRAAMAADELVSKKTVCGWSDVQLVLAAWGNVPRASGR